MRKGAIVLGLAGLFGSASCSSWLEADKGVPGLGNPWRALTGAEITTLTDRGTRLAAWRPEFSWIVSSLGSVLAELPQATTVNILTDLAPGPFYSVALLQQRSVPGASWSEYDVLMFDDPVDPKNFIVIHARATTPDSEAPARISSPVGASVKVTLFRLDESGLKSWRGSSGSVSITEESPQRIAPSACTTTAVPQGTHCHRNWGGQVNLNLGTISEGGGHPGMNGPSLSFSGGFGAVIVHNK